KGKKGKAQLVKKGSKWTKTAEEVLAPVFLGSIGLGSTGIKRALKWDEKVALFTDAAQWEIGVEKVFTAEMRAVGPATAPAGFNNPGVKGPKMLHVKIENYPTLLNPQKIKSYKPTVMFIYMFANLTKYGGDASKAESFMDDMLTKVSAANCPVYVFTPLWASEKGQSDCKTKGTNYKLCVQAAEAVRTTAAKHGYPVIDLFAMCEAEQEQGAAVFYCGKVPDNTGMAVTPHGQSMVHREMRTVLGLTKP
ncbi:MAG: hypothetical protein HRU15_16275, partial [Planctomycetes bacterium]|nr:hypothetical protein [Planctomycetota bacterium]